MENLPHGNEQLLSWAHQRYRAVTSFSELKMAHDIYIKVGEGMYLWACTVFYLSLKIFFFFLITVIIIFSDHLTLF